MKEVALFEALRGRFLSGDKISDVPPEQRLYQSIIDHLTLLLNTRRGSIDHLPEYGLPDISGIYQNMPESIGVLKKAMKETIEEYEPRMKKPVRIIEQEPRTDGFVLTFLLIAQLVDGGAVHLRTRFSTTGYAEISPATEQGL
jgi:type VI secretion system protein